MEHGPCVVPAVTLGECISPFIRAERLLERPVLVASAHETGRAVEDIPVVHCTLCPFVQLLLRPAHLLGYLQDAPVVVGIFQCTGNILVDLDIIRHIADSVVVFVSETARGIDFRMDILCSVYDSGIKGVDSFRNKPLDICVSHYGCGIVAYHAAPVSRARPFREEGVLFGDVHHSLLYLLIDRRIEQVEQRE